MRPFDLQEACKGKPICTRNGDKAELAGVFIKRGLTAVLKFRNNNSITFEYDLDGKFNFQSENASPYDLMMCDDTNK